MNSDPHDSAAWRTFGMLDADESAEFEDAMRHDPELRRTGMEKDRLAAAIAAISAEPVWPGTGALDRLQRALGHAHAPRKCPLWIAVSGWGTAAALAAWFAWLFLTGVEEKPVTALVETAPAPVATEVPHDTGMETRRLTAEIENLRRNLEAFHQRDRAMFQVVEGQALQNVMIMVPPGSDASGSLATTAMLGDALAAINRDAHAIHDEIEPADEEVVDLPMENVPPSAVPIYDAARDTGTLVVSNLPPCPAGQDLSPVGQHQRQPASGLSRKTAREHVSGAESFDFSLGSTMILPTAFMLTLDPANSPAAPGDDNTVLAGPPAGPR